VSHIRTEKSRRTLRRQRVRRRRISKLTLTLAGVPLAMGVLAGTVFAAVGGHHRTPAGAAPAASAPAKAAAAANPNPNCTLIVPANPLSAQGLATPYQLTATNPAMGPCNEANANQSAFVEAAIMGNNGQLTLYDPLVVDKGTQPAAAPAPAQVPAGSTVGIWFGFNGTNLTLKPAAGANSLTQGKCVNGQNGSVFGQFAQCNAPAFFKAANAQIANQQLQVPAQGTAKDGMPCPTTRDFSVVDQDQSDNVVTHYLANAKGQTAQNNAAGKAAVPNATDLANASDNLLLSQFIDPALGCTPWTVPDQSSGNQPSAALPLDELSAAANQKAPIALVPLNDPMTLNNANPSQAKTNLYRAGVDQAPIGAADNGNGKTYCQNMFNNPMGVQRIFKDQAMFANAPSVDAAMATNLFTFLAMRANQSFTNLGCGKLLGTANPITLTTNGNGVVTAAALAPLGKTPPSAAPSGMPMPSGSAMPSAPTGTGGMPPTASASAPAPGASASASAPAGGTMGNCPTPAPSKSCRPPKKVHW
jgi:hypothetical protein